LLLLPPSYLPPTKCINRYTNMCIYTYARTYRYM
jgi:hypothetical protein